MQKFNSLNELAEAYKAQYNARYTDAIKHFTTQEVIEICVTNLAPITAQAKGIKVSKKTVQIEGFGYVNA